MEGSRPAVVNPGSADPHEYCGGPRKKGRNWTKQGKVENIGGERGQQVFEIG